MLPPHLLPNLPNRGWRVGEEGWGEGIPFNFNTEIKKKLKESHDATHYLVGSGSVDPGHLPNRGWRVGEDVWRLAAQPTK